MRKLIQIGNLTFKTKKDAVLHFKRILNSYDFTEKLNSKDLNDVCELLKMREKSKEKIGCGIKEIEVVEVSYKIKCFNLIRVDSSTNIFSYSKCINGGFNQLTKFIRTCRYLILEDLRNVKLNYFKANFVKGFIRNLSILPHTNFDVSGWKTKCIAPLGAEYRQKRTCGVFVPPLWGRANLYNTFIPSLHT